MTLSFLCPHCSHLFEANPEVFGQTCACTSCGGFFTVPAPSQEGDKGQVYGQQDDLDAIASLREEKESLGKEADGLRERLLTKERECSEVIFERDALRERAEVSSKAHKQLESEGYDGYTIEGMTVVFSPNQIKSADPITRDDAGNIIPLSERFNRSNPDLRYSLLQPAWFKSGIAASNPLDFTGKTVLVVGGSSGIGNGIAQAFRRHGAQVQVWS